MMVGKGVALQAAWMSLRVLPAGRCATLDAAGFGTGMISEQSVSVRTSLPSVDIFAMALVKRWTMSFWLSTNDCHSQAVRGSLARACEMGCAAVPLLR